MSEHIFAINLSNGNLSLKAGYISIPRGGYKSVLVSDKNHPDFLDAFSKGWVKYSDTKPDSEASPSVKPIEYFEPNKGMSADELKAELAKDAEKGPVAPGKTEALGQSETTVGEPTVTQLGVDASVASEESTEQKCGRTSKKAAE